MRSIFIIPHSEDKINAFARKKNERRLHKAAPRGTAEPFRAARGEIDNTVSPANRRGGCALSEKERVF